MVFDWTSQAKPLTTTTWTYTINYHQQLLPPSWYCIWSNKNTKKYTGVEEKLTWANHCCTSGIPQCFTSSFKSKFIFTSLWWIPMYINVSQTQISRIVANLVCEWMYLLWDEEVQSHELKNRNWFINVHIWMATVFIEFPVGFLTSKPVRFWVRVVFFH